MQSRMMYLRTSVFLYVCLKLKISVATEPIGLHSSGNIDIGPTVVLSYFVVTSACQYGPDLLVSSFI